MKQKMRILIAMFTICSLLLTACAPKENESTGTNKDLLTVVLSAEPATLNGVDYKAIEAYRSDFGIYEQLVTFGPNNTRVPQLAKEYDISEDGKTYIFKLHENVVFHNGEKMTADDVLYSVDRALNSDRAWALSMLDTIEKVDDYTVKMNLKNPYLGFLNSLTDVTILNEKAVTEAGDDYGRNPVGTGPYKFAAWDAGQQIKVERFDEYYGEKANIKDIVFRIIPDKTTALIAFENGEVDALLGVPATDVERMSGLKNAKLSSTASQKQLYFLQNCRVDKNVRQAIAHSIDREALLKLIEGGQGHVAKAHFENLYGYSGKDAFFEKDLDKAKTLIKEAGYDNGVDVSLMVGTSDDMKIAQMAQNNLKESGINMKIESLEDAAKNDKVKNKDFDFYFRVANLSLPDMWDFVSSFHSGATNRMNVQRPDLDKLLDEIKVEPNVEVREKLYDQVIDILMDEAVVVPIYFGNTNIVHNKNLKNVTVDQFDYYNLATWSW